MKKYFIFNVRKSAYIFVILCFVFHFSSISFQIQWQNDTSIRTNFIGIRVLGDSFEVGKQRFK